MSMIDQKPYAATSRRAAMLGLAASALALPHIARAAPRRVRFGHNGAVDSHFGRGGQEFADAVAADPVIGSVLKIEIVGNGQLGDELFMMAGCTKGTVDGALIGGAVISTAMPEMGLLSAPYIFRDVAHARATLDGPIGTEFIELSRAKNLPVLAWGENGLVHLTSNVAVRTVAELRGLKLRVPPSPMVLNGMRALGADAAPLAFGLLRGALQSGEFQAQQNSIAIVESAKLHELQKYLSLTGHIYDAMGFIASADLLEDLNEAQRAALTSCARKGAVVTRQVADVAAKDGLGRLRSLGMTIIEDVDLAGFRAAARPYIESLQPTFGADRVKSLLGSAA